MRTELIDKGFETGVGYGPNRGDTEKYIYKCPCGRGRIVEEHDNVPGFRDHSVMLLCKRCSEKYTLDTSNGVRNWQVVEKDV
jgi:hypothetical protein